MLLLLFLFTLLLTKTSLNKSEFGLVFAFKGEGKKKNQITNDSFFGKN